MAASPLSDMDAGTRFSPVLADPVSGTASRVILCSGKHYYTLLEAAKSKEMDDVALIRIEELSPFPSAQLADALAQHPPSTPVIWAQEEPANQGAWSFVRPRIDAILEDRGSSPATYAGRKAGATTATGVGAWHKREMEEIVHDALEA